MNPIEKRCMFDTSALNQIYDNDGDLSLVLDAKNAGFSYYLTVIQKNEIKALLVPHKQRSNLPEFIERSRAERALEIMDVVAQINPNQAPEIATLLPNKWRLDGTFSILPDGEGAASTMFKDIYNDNPHYYNDAMIAMTAIVNGCTVVTRDKRFFNKVNKHFSGRAIKHEDFIALLKNSHSSNPL